MGLAVVVQAHTAVVPATIASPLSQVRQVPAAEQVLHPEPQAVQVAAAVADPAVKNVPRGQVMGAIKAKIPYLL